MRLSKVIKQILSSKASSQNFNNSTIRYSLQFKLLLILLSLLTLTMFFSFHLDNNILNITQNSIQVGTTWQNQALTADFTFPIFRNKTEYDQDVFKAKANSLQVFDYSSEQANKAENLIKNTFSKLVSIDANTSFVGEIELNSRLVMLFLEQPEKVRLSEINKMISLSNSFANYIYQNGFVNLSSNKLNNDLIIAEVSNVNRIYLKKKFLTTNDNVNDRISDFIKSRFVENSEPLFIDILKSIVKPNLFYNQKATDTEIELAKQNVPLYLGYVKSGDVIIDKGQLITKENKQKIDSYFQSIKLRSETYFTPSYVIGNFGQATIVFSIILVYLFVLRKKIFYDNVKLSILFVSFILIAFFSWITVEIPSSFPLAYLVPIPAVVMLSSILFDSRTAFYVTIISSLILGITRGNDMSLAIAFIFSGLLAAFTVRDIQSRTQMFRSIFFILLGLVVSIIIFDIQTSIDINYSATKIMFAIINASISPILTFGLLFIIEHTTHIATDLRIKEYDNIDHPLLKKMSEIAPGTYQHTMNVARLAERCAIDIGANPLLTRVGAYFHDIGKVAKPEYFTENQQKLENKLEMLPPKKAADVIKKHVLDGIDLGNQYKLPKRLIDFIPMHHGTSLIKHFYAKAVTEAKEDEIIKESDFRYPGPKPNSKETAILMICDTSEAISKIEGLDSEQIRDLIKKTIMEKFSDGQFSESDLTLQDLAIVENAILKSTLGIHQRTKYKEIPEDKQS